jgi:cell division protein FtsN
MSKTDGEYELVLGNRQLLSAFFIIVIMFGVFFTMGYVVGRNSMPGAPSAANTAATTQRPEAASPAPPPQEAAKETPPAETKPVETQPATPTQPEPSRRAASRPAPPPRVDQAPGAAEAVKPGPGNMYLQVAAAAQPQAGVVVDTLKQKGFPALLAQGPNPTLFRVMVGPFADAAGLGKAKAELENAGFRPLVRK